MQSQLRFLALGLFASLSTAQYVINPDSVPLSTRDAWCSSQITQCPLICLQYNSTGAEVNNCNAQNLSYECLCTNNVTPNSSEYSQTLPYYVCTEWGNQCVKGCGQDNTCANACRADHPCGAQNPQRVNTTTSSAAAATTSDGGSAATQTYGSFDSTATSTKNAASRFSAVYSPVGNQFGFLVVAAGVVGGFAFLL